MLENKNIILASGSPRRKEILEMMGLKFDIKSLDIDESYPPELKREEIPLYLSQKKSQAFGDLENNQILITADTIVWHEDKALEKPLSEDEAYEMLISLSGSQHSVFSASTVRTKNFEKSLFMETKVQFQKLEAKEILDYIKTKSPFDKAGGYGIQEAFGVKFVERIKGNYYNVMGLPSPLIYKVLKTLE